MNNDTIPGYQKYCGTKGSSLKSGCGLFFKEDLNFKEIIDLSVKFINYQNEFQSCWIETINDKIRPNVLTGVFYRHPRKTDRKFIKKESQKKK